MRILLIGLGGGAGAILRYALATAVQSAAGGAFPLGTLLVNVLGCLGIGVLSGMAESRAFGSPEAPGTAEVRRYLVINKTRHPAPPVVYASWWYCVTDGDIVAEPGESREDFGTIEVRDFKIDQSTGERGQE